MFYDPRSLVVICDVHVDCILWYSWWQHASNLASYEQQDAHEFLISMLDGIHEKMQKDRRKPHCQGKTKHLVYCTGGVGPS